MPGDAWSCLRSPVAASIKETPADLLLVDDLVSLVPLPELDEQSIMLELSSGRIVRDRDSSPT